MTIHLQDIEGNGLLDTITKIHCLSSKVLHGDITTVTGSYDSFLRSIPDGDALVWHNGFGYDWEVFVKLGVISGYNPTTVTFLDGYTKPLQLIDSLALSREWYPDHPVGHGLEAWAKKLGTHKPEIDDWENLPIETYIDRCENDCITTEKLFLFLCDKLGIEL